MRLLPVSWCVVSEYFASVRNEAGNELVRWAGEGRALCEMEQDSRVGRSGPGGVEGVSGSVEQGEDGNGSVEQGEEGNGPAAEHPQDEKKTVPLSRAQGEDDGAAVAGRQHLQDEKKTVPLSRAPALSMVSLLCEVLFIPIRCALLKGSSVQCAVCGDAGNAAERKGGGHSQMSYCQGQIGIDLVLCAVCGVVSAQAAVVDFSPPALSVAFVGRSLVRRISVFSISTQWRR